MEGNVQVLFQGLRTLICAERSHHPDLRQRQQHEVRLLNLISNFVCKQMGYVNGSASFMPENEYYVPYDAGFDGNPLYLHVWNCSVGAESLEDCQYGVWRREDECGRTWISDSIAVVAMCQGVFCFL